MVLALVKRNMIGKDCFTTSDKGCFLNPEGRKIFLSAYNKKIRSLNQYMENKVTFRECINKQCRAYSTAIMNDNLEKYMPLRIY